MLCRPDRYEAACDRTFQPPTLVARFRLDIPGPGDSESARLDWFDCWTRTLIKSENQRIARTGDTAVAPNIANAATTTDTTATGGTTSPAIPYDSVGYPD
jgi:hypothetical protein